MSRDAAFARSIRPPSPIGKKHALHSKRREKRHQPEQKKAIVDGVHQALVDSIGMPADELFNLISEYEPGNFFYDRRFNGIARSDNLVVLEITMRRGRSDAMKKALYAAIAANLEQGAGVSPRDVFIFTHENDYSDWSVGNGQFAMAIVQQRGADA